MSLVDGILLVILAAILFFAIRSMIKQRKKGGCAYCSGKDQCSTASRVNIKPSMEKKTSKTP